MSGREVVTVAEDRPERRWYRAGRGFAPNEVLVGVIAFKRAMQPLTPRLVAVAVAHEGAVCEWRTIWHVRL
jgi:hypothetical protein